MKPLLYAALFVISASLEAADEPPPVPAGSDVKRFSIFASKFQDGGNTVDVILRIDTATGRTWRLVPTPKLGISRILGWERLEENVGSAGPSEVQVTPKR